MSAIAWTSCRCAGRTPTSAICRPRPLSGRRSDHSRRSLPPITPPIAPGHGPEPSQPPRARRRGAADHEHRPRRRGRARNVRKNPRMPTKRRFIRTAGKIVAWAPVYALGLVAIFLAQTWVWWQQEPRVAGTTANAMWARHQWVGLAHTDAEYRALAGTIRRARITDVYFHAGPFDADGGVPAAKYAHAGELIVAMRRYAPGVRLQAYLGQIRKVDDHGLLALDDPAVRDKIVRTDQAMLDIGFDGIHYDIEPIFPDDGAFVALLDDTAELTRARGRLLSVSL